MSRTVIGGPSCRHAVPVDLHYSFFGPHRSQMNIALPRASDEQQQAFTINDKVSLDHLAWLKVPDIQRCFYEAGDSKGSGVISEEPVKGKSFLWNVHALSSLKPSELTLYFLCPWLGREEAASRGEESMHLVVQTTDP